MKKQKVWNKGLKGIYSSETLEKMSKSHKGQISGMKGKHHTEESKKKNSDAHIGRHHLEKTKKKIGDAHRNKIVSEETKKKMSEINLGKLNPMYGKHLSEDHKKKISEANKNKIMSEEAKIKISIANSGKNNGMYGKKHTEEFRKRVSGRNSGRFGKSPKHSKGCYYESPLQGKIWLRSTYELAYAKYLDENKILWYYEIKTFDLGDTTYTPDFFLIKDDKFIEIKGWYTDEYRIKINKFLEQYPFDLEILFEKDLKELGINLKQISF